MTTPKKSTKNTNNRPSKKRLSHGKSTQNIIKYLWEQDHKPKKHELNEEQKDFLAEIHRNKKGESK